MSSLTDGRPKNLCSPVDELDSSLHHAKPEEGTALCLSGGGYRAMLFHVGTLWRLNEAGYLPRLNRISSVSGGSITAGMLGLAWETLGFDATGVAKHFLQKVVSPLRGLAAKTIDIPSVISGALGPGTIGDRIANAYRKHLYGDATLQALPDQPRFVINATNLQSGALWRFMKPYMRDYRVGEIRAPRLLLATAVAASSAFPPVLSPVRLRFQENDYSPGSNEELHRPPFTTDVHLTDGGVYDNMGLETAWKRHTTILVSDAGGHMAAEPNPRTDWLQHTRRVLEVIDNQVRSLRARQVIDSFRLQIRKGAYWGIRTNLLDYKLPDALPCPHETTMKLALIKTRLARLGELTQERLINWGYASCDAAVRKYADPAMSRPTGFPYHNAGIG